MPIGLKPTERVAIDPTRQYDLLDLIDVAQRANPETRVAWERARQAAIGVGLVESEYFPMLALATFAGYQSLPLPAPQNLIPGGFFRVDVAHLVPGLGLKWLLLDSRAPARGPRLPQDHPPGLGSRLGGRRHPPAMSALIAGRVVGPHLLGNGLATLMLIHVLLAGHLAHMALWALAFVAIGEFGDFTVAFYHSAVNYATLGYGDIVMSPRWRLLGPLQAINGTLAFGWSTAAIVTVVTRLTRYRHRARLRQGSRLSDRWE